MRQQKLKLKIMSTAKSTPAKKAVKKVAKKVVAKKAAAPKVLRAITREDFPTTGWGLSEKAHDQVFKIAKEIGARNLSQVIRAALKKAYGIEG